jgi:CHAT domain-containing protein
MRHWLHTRFLVTLVLGVTAVFAPAHSQTPKTASLADITAILDSEAPDPTRIADLRAKAAATPGTLSKGELARFFHSRSQTKLALGDYRGAIADCEQAVEAAKTGLPLPEYAPILQSLALQYGYMGELKQSLDVWLRMAREMDRQGTKGRLFNANRNIAQLYIAFGDLKQAQTYVERNSALHAESTSWVNATSANRAWWQGDVERGRAALFDARGQYQQAEQAMQRVEVFFAQAVRAGPSGSQDARIAPNQGEHALDNAIAQLGRAKAKLGRMAEGEADIRRALLSRLRATGKYNLQTEKFIGFLAALKVEQGRLAEAEKLTRAQLEIHKALGVPPDANAAVVALNQFASILNLQGRWQEASAAYLELDKATVNWPASRRENLLLNTNQIATLFATNNLSAGLAAADRLLRRQKELLGDTHTDTALVRGMAAIGLALSGKDADAEREFKLAVPILAKSSRESDMDDALNSAARDQRMALVIEAYIALLARKGTDEAALESFGLADVVRGRSVQSALAASSARVVARTPVLADLARKEQDLDRQLVAQLGLLNGLLAQPAAERDDKVLGTLRSEIDKLRKARDAAKKELAGRFKNYSDLVEPQPATVEEIRKVLVDDEAFVSFYFGRNASFVWAVSKSGLVGFKPLNLTAADLETKVAKLRVPFTSSVIEPFDVALAHSLYAEILQPVEHVWKSAKSLTVVANGALGMLPLGLLPTAPSDVQWQPEADRYAGYRTVPWLIRTHAVTMVPSGSSLRTLRQLPPASAKREPLIGFGDPYFNQQQADDAQKAIEVAHATEAETTLRSLKTRRRAVRSGDDVTLSDLDRLPDTGEELEAIAKALSIDPAKALRLGKDANEKTIKSMDLTRYRFVVFATHGLVPPQLGLSQPAIALTAPKVANVDGDGLLTMEEVLGLKLDADWVVLSACNTGAGAVEGAEAVSGLGRAFFYAGTRALLLTNWEVDSLSARDLVKGTFAILATDAKISRAEALRRSVLELMDGPGLVRADGTVVRTYAHPYFWAAYSIVGDGATVSAAPQ